jgi:hypothetical protein
MTDDATPREVGSHAGLGLAPERASKAALAQALLGIADGFDQQRPLFRPDALVMHTLRRAALALERAETEKAADVAAERERCAQIVENVQGWEGVRDVAARIRA